ncbi:MAG: hypothetical protein WC393_04330 [Candidatus Nanoarchaeia archaeon]|jgi:hypothetical protein
MADKLVSILEINIFFKELSEFLIHSKDLFEKDKETISTQALKNFNKLNENDFLLNLIKNIDEIGDDLTDANDAFFNYLNSHNLNLHITRFYKTINLVEEFLKANIAFSDKSSLKNHLIKIIDSFNESKKSLNEFNSSIEKLINNISNSQEKESEIKGFLNTIKDEIKKSNEEVNKISITSEEIIKIPIFNKEYFNKRKEELILLQNNYNFYTNIVNIIKLFSVKDEAGNKLTNNYAHSLNKALDTTKFKELLQQLINVLNEKKSPVFKILEGNQLDKELSYFKAKLSSFKIEDYKYPINELNKNISSLNLGKNFSGTLKKLQKEIILLSKIKNNEEIIGGKIKEDDKNIIYPDFNEDFNKLILEINKVTNYKLIDDSLFNNLEKEKISEDKLKILNELKTINKYVRTDMSNDYYKGAEDYLKNNIKDFDKIKKIVLDNKKTPEERVKDAVELRKIIKELNEFNIRFFGGIKDYLDDKKVGNIKCVLANEMGKINYFSLLIKNMNLIDDKEMKARAKELDAKIGGIAKKEAAMNKLLGNQKDKDFITKSTVNNDHNATHYWFFDYESLNTCSESKLLEFITKFKEKDKVYNDEKTGKNILLNAISTTESYLNNLKTISKIFEDMIIENLE